MQSPNNNPQNHRFIICITLVLCICFLGVLDGYLSKATVTEEITQVLATVSPTPKPTPTPTPYPTPTPQPIATMEAPEDPYPDLYGDNPTQSFFEPEEKVIYLTFDDGPSDSTQALLQTLKEEDVRATFFVMGDTPKKRELLQQILFDGHAIGVHTYTHDYSYVYWNKSAYLADFCRQYYTIWDVTGYRPRIFRFPGGSINSYNKHLYRDLIPEMETRGFVYYDWNVTSEDAKGNTDPQAQLEELIHQSQNKNRIIALLHDTDKNPEIATTVQEYIRRMKENGYTFKPLDSRVKPIQFPGRP